MKKWFSKIKFIVVMTMLVGLLTGCNAGSTVETTLTINNDLSGSRVMELVINQSVFDENFSGTIEQLNEAITGACPSQLNWAYDDSTGSKIYKFTLDFSSPDDYKTKVDALLGEGSDVKIDITQAESVWASGVKVEESFSSSDILAWLKTLLVEKGFVSSSNSSKIFQLGNSKVIYRGEEYSSGNTIYVDRMEYLDIDRIELLTDVNGYDSYNKTIVLTIPEDAMAKKGEEIKTWLAERVPTGATSEWSQKTRDDGEVYASVFKVSKQAMTGEDLANFLKHYFNSELCAVEQNKVKENMSPFAFTNSLVETIDFTNYVLSDRAYRTDIYSYVIGTNGYAAGRYIDELSYNNEDEYNDSDEYPGYKRTNYTHMEDSLRQYSSFSQKVYRVKNVNVETSVGLFDDISKEYTFTLAGVPTEAEREEILGNINAYGLVYAEIKKAAEAKDEANTEENGTELSTEENETELSTEEAATEEEEVKVDWEVEVEDKEKDGVYTVTIKQEGDKEEREYSSKALFGSSRASYVTKSYGFASLSYPIAIYDGYSLGHFVDYRVEDASGTYVLNAGLGSSIEYANQEGAIIDGSTVTISGPSVLGGTSIIVYGSQFNIWALLFYILLIGGVVCVVLVLKKEGIIDQLLAMIPKSAPAAQTTAAQAPVEETPMFCENCGAPRDADACVCTQCGTKFSE